MAAASSTLGVIEVVGAHGEISLGEEFAGRQVLVEVREPGVWLVRTATVIPDNERWLENPEARADLDSALAWAAENPTKSDNAEELLAKFDAWD
jgi:hypothetical protein